MKLKRYLTEAREQLKQWNEYIKTNKELAAGVKILQTINKLGYKAYIVGGSVRDIVLGDLKPHDIDIATNAPIEVLEKKWKTHDIGKSRDFGIVTVKQNGFDFEIAQFRADGTYSDGRRPDTVTITGSFEDDASRRDFTINAMGVNASGEIVDYFDGKRDIKNKVLKTVGNPYKRFSEDYLRMMRAARFSSKLGMDIDPDTKKAIKKLSPNILDLPAERIRDEILKAASQSGEKFARYIEMLADLKILRLILPEVLNMKYFKHNLQHHPEGDVWQHTMAALKAAKATDPIQNLAILLHDVGKGVTLSHKEGLPKYLGHARASVKLVDDVATRLRMTNKEREALLFAVGNHMKFHNILGMKPSKIAKIVSDDNWDVLVAVGKGDEFSRGNTFMHAGEFEKIVDKAIEIKNKFGMKKVNKTLKLVDGKDVMKLTGLPPGKKLGDIIKKTTNWIMDNGIEDKEEINNYILKLARK